MSKVAVVASFQDGGGLAGWGSSSLVLKDGSSWMGAHLVKTSQASPPTDFGSRTNIHGDQGPSGRPSGQVRSGQDLVLVSSGLVSWTPTPSSRAPGPQAPRIG